MFRKAQVIWNARCQINGWASHKVQIAKKQRTQSTQSSV